MVMRRALARALGWLGVRMATWSAPTLLPAAIWLQRQAVLIAGGQSKDFPLHLSNLGVTYEQLHRLGQAGALTSAVAAHATALTRVGPGSPVRVTIMSNLGSALLERFDLQGVREDLDRAQAVLRDAVAACPPTHSDRGVILVNAATAQFFCLDRFRDQAAGRAGIALCAEASAGLSPADPLAADVQTLWGQLLHALAEASGSSGDLDAAIGRLETSVLMAQRSRGDVPHARTALARALRLRADRHGRLDDLTRAIGHVEAALAETPAGLTAARHSRMGTLAVSLASRFQWTRQPADIDAAIVLFDHLIRADGPRALRHRANLAVCLTERAATAGARLDDLDQAIDLLLILTSVPADSATGPALWAALADALLDRAEATDSPNDLAEAHRAAEEAVRTSPPDSPALARHLGVLSEALLDRYHAGGGEEDIEAAIRACADAFRVQSGLPRERIRAALLWSHCAATASRWPEAVHAHDQGRFLVPRLLAPDLRPTDGLRLVEDLAEAGPDALALSLQAGRPDLGLVRAEQWRDLVLGPDRARRELWTLLLAAHPALGERLESVIARSAVSPGDDLLFSGRPFVNDDLQQLRARLRSYVDDDDPRGVLSADSASILHRIETRLRGREAQAPADLATLLAQLHLARYQVLPVGEDQPELTAAVRWYRRVLRTHPERVPEELRELFDAGAFGPDEPEFGDPDLLSDSEIEAGVRQLEPLAADGNPRWQATLAAFLSTAYERFGREDDLDGAIDLGRSVLRNESASPSETRAARTNLAGALLNRFVRFSDRNALEEAVTFYEQAVAERGSAADHANAGLALLTRFEVTAESPDLEAALHHAREAVTGTAESDPSYAARLSNLAATVRALYDESGDDRHLDEALGYAKLAVSASPPDDPAKARRLSNLCAVLSTRFEKCGAGHDIDRAIEAGRASVESGPSSGAPGRVSNLLLALHLRGAARGSVADLQEALRLGREVAASLPEDHADRPDILTNAAGAAMTWFDWTGDVAAITQAVDLSREAVATLEDNGRRGLLHTNLSMHLLTRFEVTGDAADVDDAVRHAEAGAHAARGPAAAIAQSNLAVALRTRYEIAGVTPDLDRAVAAARAAVGGTPPQHRDQPAMESNLSLCLWQAGDRAEALECARAALDDPLASGTPSHAAYAANVARMVTVLGGRPEEIGALWGSVSRDVTAPVPLRIEAHVALARQPDATARVVADDLAQAVTLLPVAAWHGVGVPSRLRRLRDWQGIGRDAAAASLGADGPERALRLLDAALSQLWERQVPSTGEEERLRRTRPDLARKLGQLREALSR